MAADAQRVRVYGPEPHALLGAAHIAGGELIPDRLLSPAEVAAIVSQSLELARCAAPQGAAPALAAARQES
jgi:tRNA pseudouridine55 synthase